MDQRHKKSKDKMLTKTGKHLLETMGSDMYARDGSPPWRVLKHHNSCRLVDPSDRECLFFTASCVPEFSNDISKAVRQQFCTQPDDIFLWVYRAANSAAKKSSTTNTAAGASSDVSMSVGMLSGLPYTFSIVQSHDIEARAVAHVIASSMGDVKYSSSRRTGYVVLRNLKLVV